MGVIGTLGATALSTEMTTMSLEFPMLTTAMRNKLNVDETKDFTCESFYKSYKLVSDDDATSLCTKSQYFNFSDTMETSVALTNMYIVCFPCTGQLMSLYGIVFSREADGDVQKCIVPSKKLYK